MSNKILALELGAEGTEMYLDATKPNNFNMYKSVMEQFDLDSRQARRVLKTFERAEKIIQHVIKEG